MANKNSIITLNVGGRKFATYKSTLACSNYFVNLLDGEMQNNTFFDDTVLIDRDGELFEYVLHFLTTGDIYVDDDAQLNSLKQDADFYQLPAMIKAIEKTEAALKKNFRKFILVDVEHLDDMSLQTMVDEGYIIVKCLMKEAYANSFQSYFEIPQKLLLVKERLK